MKKLNFWETLTFCEEKVIAQAQEWSCENPQNLIRKQDHETTHRLTLPFIFPLLSADNWENDLKSFVKNIDEDFSLDYLILLIQAGGNAGLAHIENGEILNHKIIRKYMVRQKQGKSQLKHLNAKGKSKLGSRIRLAQTKDFFEEINQKLQEWEIEHIPKIYYSASPDVWHAVFEAKEIPPFEKKDNRLIKIPLDLPLPTMDEIVLVKSFLQESTLFDF